VGQKPDHFQKFVTRIYDDIAKQLQSYRQLSSVQYFIWPQLNILCISAVKYYTKLTIHISCVIAILPVLPRTGVYQSRQLATE